MDKIALYQVLNSWLHRAGLDFRRFPTPEMRSLVAYLKKNKIRTCLDVGANTGQYARLLRSSGYQSEIISFEPQSHVFNQLKNKMQADPQWKGFNIGLGNTDGFASLNISKNSFSSSILNFADGDASVKAEPNTAFVSKENITISRLDTFLTEQKIMQKIFLKIDAQGYEWKILEGTGTFLNNIYALQVELACVPLYEGEKLFDEMKHFIESKGFYLASLQSGFTDPESGRLLQVESIFFK